MKASKVFLLVIVASLSFGIAACQSERTAILDGSGYQFVRFSNPKAAVAASQDASAGPAIAGNNAQCRRDAGCRK